MLVELKTGETVNGHLLNVDNWMNLTLQDVVSTDAEGQVFTRIPEIYIRGNFIKFIKFSDEIITRANEMNKNNSNRRHDGQGRRGYNNQRQHRGNRRYNNQQRDRY